MNTIDQRILIPTPPNVVWDYLGDLAKNPEWQADCISVSFLTSKRSGPGTRLRLAGEKGQERVVEITAWYDGLGYQYTYIDGMPFRESTGRIRLQEIPEGTVVQWTFTYDVGGLLGGMRSTLGLGRQLEATMETSLKALWKQVNQTGGAQKIREAKSLMRDAPDYEARAQYKPRHPAVVDVKGNDEAKTGLIEPALPTRPTPAVPADENAAPKLRPSVQPIPIRQWPDEPARPAAYSPQTPVLNQPPVVNRTPIIDEPPVAEDDTRPRRPVSLPVDELIETTEEPEFLDEMVRFAPPPDYTVDTQPIKPITDEDMLQQADEPPAVIPVDFEPVAEAEIHAPETDIAPPTPEPAIAIVDQPEDLTSDTVAAAADAYDAFDSRTLGATVEAPPTDLPTAPVLPLVAAPSAADEPAETPAPEPVQPSMDITQGPRIPDREELSKLDTATMSIWEIFGVPPPSATEAAQSVKAEVESTAEATVPSMSVDEAPVVQEIVALDLPSAPPVNGGRGGLRMKMRRHQVKLRFPE